MGLALLVSPTFAVAKKAQPSKPLILAQNSQLAITLPAVNSTTEKKEVEKKFSMGLSLSHSQNLYEAANMKNPVAMPLSLRLFISSRKALQFQRLGQSLLTLKIAKMLSF